MRSKTFRGATASFFIAALAGCGGGGSGSATQPGTPTSTTLTVTGTAATGLAIPGATITGKCKVGTSTATTLADGTYALTITDGQLPCMLQITNPVGGGKLHTVVTGTGSAATANITPLTEMATARVLGSEPTVFFAGFDAAVIVQKITLIAVQIAQTDISHVLAGTMDTTVLGNFISTPLKAATQGSPTTGDAQDKLLDALKLKISNAQIAMLVTALASNQTTEAINQTFVRMTTAPITSGIYSYLADTGQTLSYTTTKGEDSDYSGKALSFSDMSNGTVLDESTGLLWQKTPDMVNRTYASAKTYCADLNLGSLSDWRVPNKKEMMGILNYGRNPVMDPVFYSDGSFQTFWTSPYTNGVGFAWMVSATYGWAAIRDAVNFEKIRCVSGPEITYGVLTDNRDGTVTDATTQLQWIQSETAPVKWEDAIAYCENLEFTSYTDWRLPNIKEISTLTQDPVFIDSTVGNTASLDFSFFPDSKRNEGGGLNPYWSSSTAASSPTDGWVINFTTGYPIAYSKASSYSVRCVRGGL